MLEFPEKRDRKAEEQFHRLYCRVSELRESKPLYANEELNRLFEALREGKGGLESQEIEDRIWVLWCSHEEQEACARMESCIQAIAKRDDARAHKLLDEMGTRWKGWAEVWNKRATLLFLEGRDAESLSDIDRTLSLEPRHFGALCGLGQIAIRQGEPHLALAGFQAAVAINPNLAGARATAESLHRSLRCQNN